MLDPLRGDDTMTDTMDIGSTLRLPEKTIAITQVMVDRYAEISGDFNPIHVDTVMAVRSAFGRTIAHGCIPLEPVFQSIQAWIGADQLPRGTRLRLRYRAPAHPGDRITAKVDLLPCDEGGDGALRKLAFTCHNQRAQLVMDGECDVPA